MNEQTILVVDDTPQILKLSKDIFEIAGFKVITAQDGEQALQILAEKKIDLVVTDILMPNTDGYILCYTIRTTEKLKDIPVIIYSATYTSSSDEAMAMEIGADKFIRKPAPINELIEAAQHLLSDSRNYVHKIPAKPKSIEATQLYSEGLVNKLERRNFELEEAKQKLELGESRLKDAQAISHVGSWEIDLLNNTQHWSDELYNIFGIKREEATPTIELFLSFMHPENFAYASKKVRGAFDNLEDSSFEFRFIRKDGTIRYGFSKYRFEFDKSRRPLRLFGIVQDITEKKLAEEALRTAHERLLFHMENTPLGFIEFDNHHRVKSWSKTAENIFGWTEKELLDSKQTGLSTVHEEDLQWVKEMAHQLLSGGLDRSRIQNRNYTKDRRVIWCEWFNSVLRNKEGQVVTIMSLVQDITERKTLEVNQREKLKKLVEERTRELNESLAKEKELVEMKNKFVSIASHEFRTPLSTISLASGFIKKYIKKLSKTDLEKKLESIEKQVQIMTYLLDDVLTVGKAEAGKLQVKVGEIKIEMIEILAREAMKTAGSKHKLKFSTGCSQEIIHSDEKFLRNIITNLITNAAKFSPHAKEVLMDITCDKNDLFITVKDHGIGIPTEDIKNLFTSFSRGSNVSGIEGTGLGLSIVKKAVELLKGSIAVKSELGKGTEFKVTLPLHNV